MKEMNLEETLEFKRHVRMYLYDLGSGTVNEDNHLLAAAEHHLKKMNQIAGRDDNLLYEILDPFIWDSYNRPVLYKYYFDKMREKGLHIMNDEEIERARKEKKSRRRK